MKILFAPNGKRIVGTSEQMLTCREIIIHGKNPDGSIDFEYDEEADARDYYETEEHRKDKRGRLLYQDTDGRDWPESKLELREVAAEDAA